MQEKFTISADILGTLKYVSELVPATNGKKAVGNYCLSADEAIHYDSRNAAYDDLLIINNLQERDFKITPVKKTSNYPKTRKPTQQKGCPFDEAGTMGKAISKNLK